MLKKLVGALLFSHAAQSQEIRNFDRVTVHDNLLVLSMDGHHKQTSENNIANFLRTRKAISDYLAIQQNEKLSEIQYKDKKTKNHNIL